MKKIKIGIFGPKGRMGESIIEQIDNYRELQLSSLCENKKHSIVGKEFAGIYCEELSGLPDLELPFNSQDPSSNMHLFVIKSPRRDSLKQYLEEHGVGTAIHYPTILPDMVPYEHQGNYMNARKLSKECLSLPLNPWMKKEEVYRVCKLIKDFF